MIFLTEQDFNSRLDSNIRSQITEGNQEVLDGAEQSAMAVIQDALSATYDLDFEFAKTEEERHRNLIKWMLNLAIYFIYEKVPDNQVPERVVKNYNDAMSELRKLEAGKTNTTLQKMQDDTGDNITVFRWGSNKPRTHVP